MRRFSHQIAQAQRARQTQLAKPAAKRERVLSRTKFRKLDANQALIVAKAEQPALMERPTGATPNLPGNEEIMAYRSQTTAVVERETKRGIERALVEGVGVPLATKEGPAGAPRFQPIDLRLRDAGTSWAPVNAAVPLALPKQADAPAEIGRDLRLTVGDSDVSAAVVNDDRLFYGEVGNDLDAVLEPDNAGLELSWVLRSPEAPSLLPIDLSSAGSDELRVDILADGSARLTSGGNVRGTVSQPVAWDAQGTPVTAKLVLDGSGLAVEVLHAREDLAYPIVVDPLVAAHGNAMLEGAQTSNNWAFQTYQGYVLKDKSGADEFGPYRRILATTSDGGGQGSAWFYFDPVRDTTAFRAEYFRVSRGYGNTCLGIGLYGRESGFADTGWAGFWGGVGEPTGPPHGAANSAFGNCGYSQDPSYVLTCEEYCGWTGTRATPNNLAVFQLNTDGPIQYDSAAQFRGAFVYSRESVRPTLAVSGLPASGWVNRNTFDGVVRGNDGQGGGFCSIAGPVVQVVSPGGGSGASPGCGSGGVDGPAVATTQPLPWTTGTLPEGKDRDITVSIRDIFGNVSDPSPSTRVHVDIKSPTVTYGGRLGTYLTESTPTPQFFPLVKRVIRTITGNVDLNVSIDDNYVGGPVTSGVSSATVTLYRLHPGSGMPDTTVPGVPLRSGPVDCAGQDDCKVKTFRVPPSVFGNLQPGAYEIRTETTDRAGNSVTVRRTFAKGGGTLASVVDGQATARWVPLQAERASATSARFQWMSGNGAWADIPVEALSVEGNPGTRPPLDLPVTGGKTERIVLDLETLNGGTFTNDQLRIRALFGGTYVNEFDRQSEDVVIRLDRGGRDTSDHRTNLGPGAVDLLTGNLGIGATDASVSGNGYGVSLARSYASRYVAKTDGSRLSTEDDGLMGPGWTVTMPSDGLASFTKVVDLDDPARDLWWSSEAFDDRAVAEERIPAVEVHMDDGTSFVFEHSEADSGGDVYTPEAGFEQYSLQRVTAADNATTAKFELTDRSSGASATFENALADPARPVYDGNPEHGTFGITTATGPTAKSTPRWAYVSKGSDARDAAGKPTDMAFAWVPVRTLVSTDPSITCDPRAAIDRAGCFGLEFEYLNPGTTYNPSARYRLGAVSRVANGVRERLVEYRYSGAEGRLTEVVDVRGGGSTTTSFEYDGIGLLTKATAPGEEPHLVTYLSDTSDRSAGRVRNISRATIAGAWTVLYGDRTWAGANPWDLSPGTISAWGQTVTPFRAAAIVPPDVTVQPDSAAADLRKTMLQKSSISYLDALGREINHAEPGERISATELDKWGNVTRSLTPANRKAAMTPASGTTQDAANRLATVTTYALNDRNMPRPVKVVSPEHTLRTAAGSTGERGRQVSLTTYDEGLDPSNPDYPYDLPTTLKTGALTGTDAAGNGGTERDMLVTKTEYQLSTRIPTVVTEDAAGTANVRRFVLDDKGREVERRQPKYASTSDTQSTIKTTYYTHDGTGTCASKPDWAGLVCEVGPLGTAPTSGNRKLPTKRVEYDAWRRPVKKYETAVSSGGSSNTRTSNMTYDAKDRVVEETMTGTGSGVGLLMPKFVHVYDATTGREKETQQIDGSTTRTVTRDYDSLGRPTTYTDSLGAKQVTSYDSFSRPSTVSQWNGSTQLATQTYTYDATTGYVTGLKDSGLDTNTPMTASYDLDGRPTTVVYPSGVTKAIKYDETGSVVDQRYTKTTGCSAACTWYWNTVVRSPHGQIRSDDSSSGARAYAYDSLGRLTKAVDKPTGKVCTTRTYAYDPNSNRESRRSTPAAAVADACPAGTSGGTQVISGYDDADRLISTKIGSGTAEAPSYDAWGRVLTLPASASGGSPVTSTYWMNDLVRTIESGNVSITNGIDPLQRLRSREATTTGQTTIPREEYAYGSDGDSPMFTRSSTRAAPTTFTGWSRYVQDPTGDMAAQVTSAGVKSLQVANIRGDIVAEVNAVSTATGLGATFSADEFGVPTTTTTGRKYSFLGAKQRESMFGGQVIAMGVRTYSPNAGRFLQTDPVIGGSANAYDYVDQDPMNAYDLDGRMKLQRSKKGYRLWFSREETWKIWTVVDGAIGQTAQDATDYAAAGVCGLGVFKKALKVVKKVAKALGASVAAVECEKFAKNFLSRGLFDAAGDASRRRHCLTYGQSWKGLFRVGLDAITEHAPKFEVHDDRRWTNGRAPNDGKYCKIK